MHSNLLIITFPVSLYLFGSSKYRNDLLTDTNLSRRFLVRYKLSGPQRPTSAGHTPSQLPVGTKPAKRGNRPVRRPQPFAAVIIRTCISLDRILVLATMPRVTPTQTALTTLFHEP